MMRNLLSPRTSLKEEREREARLGLSRGGGGGSARSFFTKAAIPEQSCCQEASSDGPHPVHPVVGPVVGHHGGAKSPGGVQTRPGHVPAATAREASKTEENGSINYLFFYCDA